MFEQVKELLVDELSIDESNISMTSDLVNDLGINSLELTDLILLCEERFDIEIDDNAIKKFKSVGDVVEYISKNVL